MSTEGTPDYRPSPASCTVLVVDDMQRDLKLVSEALKEHGIRVLVARSGESALLRAASGQPDLILLDAIMPGIDGFETCRRLKSEPQTRDIPVIFMTALESMEDKLEAFSAGAVDYVTKPIHNHELLARVDAHLRIRTLTRGLEKLVEERTRDLVTANRWLEEEVRRHERTAIELVRARDEAEAASRAKSSFLSNVSHEFHTPLNAIFGYAQLLQISAEEHQLDHDTFRGPIAEILDGAGQLLEMINEVLAMSARESNTLRVHRAVFDLAETIDEVAERGSELASRSGNQFELTCSRPLGEIDSDRTKLVAILDQLLDNAAKFTEGGTIRLEVAREESPAPESRAWLVCRVVDTGIGIAEKDLPRLFRPFEQLDMSTTRSHGGTGLGLTLAKYYCDLLEGEVSAASGHARGSTFTVRIPWQRPPSADQVPSGPIGREPDRSESKDSGPRRS